MVLQIIQICNIINTIQCFKEYLKTKYNYIWERNGLPLTSDDHIKAFRNIFTVVYAQDTSQVFIYDKKSYILIYKINMNKNKNGIIKGGYQARVKARKEAGKQRKAVPKVGSIKHTNENI